MSEQILKQDIYTSRLSTHARAQNNLYNFRKTGTKTQKLHAFLLYFYLYSTHPFDDFLPNIQGRESHWGRKGESGLVERGWRGSRVARPRAAQSSTRVDAIYTREFLQYARALFRGFSDFFDSFSRFFSANFVHWGFLWKNCLIFFESHNLLRSNQWLKIGPCCEYVLLCVSLKFSLYFLINYF